MITSILIAITIVIVSIFILKKKKKNKRSHHPQNDPITADPMKYAGCCIRGDCPWPSSAKDIQIPENLKICNTVAHTRAEMISKVSQHFGQDPSHLPEKELKAAFLKAAVWPQGTTLNVGFIKDGNFAQEKADWVKKIVNEKLQPLIGLKFTFDQPLEKSQIRITFDKSKGSWSMVGTEALKSDGKEPTMNLGWLDSENDGDYNYKCKGTGSNIQHEFGHAIGMVHEHSRQDAALPWNCEIVYKTLGGKPNYWDKATVDSNVLNPVPQGQLDGSPYDRNSVMHYFFPKWFFVGDFEQLNFATGYSDQDKEWISKMYPPPSENKKNTSKILMWTGIGLGILLVAILIFFVYKRYRKN